MTPFWHRWKATREYPPVIPERAAPTPIPGDTWTNQVAHTIRTGAAYQPRHSAPGYAQDGTRGYEGQHRALSTVAMI